MRFTKLGASLLVCVMVFGACSSGGSGDEGDETVEETEPTEDEPEETPSEDAGPTAEEFIAEAEEICVSSTEEAVALNAKAGIPTTKKADFALGEKLIAIRQGRLDRFETLEAPEELQTDFDSYVETRQKSADVIQERFDALKDGETKKAAKLLDGVEKLDDQWQAIGEEIGFEACANKLTPEAEKEVTETLVQFFEGDVTKTCSGFVTKTYLEYLGGKSQCTQVLSSKSGVKISEVEGISGIDASATIKGSSYGKPLSVGVTFEDGKYKVRSFFYL